MRETPESTKDTVYAWDTGPLVMTGKKCVGPVKMVTLDKEQNIFSDQ